MRPDRERQQPLSQMTSSENIQQHTEPYVYCNHLSREVSVPVTRTILSPGDFMRGCFNRLELIGPCPTYEQGFGEFEKEQPGLCKVLSELPFAFNSEPHRHCVALCHTLWQTFRDRFPQVRAVTVNELNLISLRVERAFEGSPVCLCGFYQLSLMRSLSGLIDKHVARGELSVPEGGFVTRFGVMVIEALDQASYLPMPPTNMGGDKAPDHETPVESQSNTEITNNEEK
jgi:hypothetical protein